MYKEADVNTIKSLDLMRWLYLTSYKWLILQQIRYCILSRAESVSLISLIKLRASYNFGVTKDSKNVSQEEKIDNGRKFTIAERSSD